MTSDFVSRLQRQILTAGFDDWVPLLAMDGMLRAADESLSRADRAQQLADPLAGLVDRGLAELGTVTHGSGFAPCEAASTRQRVSDAYAGADSPGWGFAFWSRNTAAGDERAARLSAPPSSG